MALNQQASMTSQFASINMAIRSQGEAVPANLVQHQSIIRYDKNYIKYRLITNENREMSQSQ